MPRTPRDQQSKPIVPENPRLWDRDMTCAFFGGIDVSTLYRGVHSGRYPRPVNVSNNVVRWLAEECEETLNRLIAERNAPKPPHRRGRPARRARVMATATETEAQ